MKRTKLLPALLLCALLLIARAAPAYAAELPSLQALPFLDSLITAVLRLVNYLRFAIAVLPPPVF